MNVLRILAPAATLAVISIAAGAASALPNVERLDSRRVAITWQSSIQADVYISDRPTVDTRRARLISNDDRDGRHVATASDRTRWYFLIRNRLDNDVIVTSERVLPLDRGSNFRDIGGYEAADGRHVRWGQIYRSAATPLLSEHDVAYIRALGLRALIDLRSTEERQLISSRLAGEGIPYVALDYAFSSLVSKKPLELATSVTPAAVSAYHEVLTELAPQFRAIFLELLANRAPLTYHCTAGQDRTGVATALVLSALGVRRATVLEDYHLSTISRRPEYEAPVIDPARYPNNSLAKYFSKAPAKPAPLYTASGHSMLSEALDEIDARWGSVEAYLEQVLNVGPAERARLRARYLE